MTGPVQTRGEVLAGKRVGRHHHVSVVARGVAEQYRPGAQVALRVGGPLSELLLRLSLPVHRVRPSATWGGTVDLVVDPDRYPEGPAHEGARWLAAAPAGTPVDVLGPVGRPFALPREAATCVLVGDGAAAAPLTGLAERLRERGCPVHVLLGGRDESDLFATLEARRAARTVTVTTRDGSVGRPGRPQDALPELLERTDADVVYASGDDTTLAAVAVAAERHGAWSQVLPAWSPASTLVCGTGVCFGCLVPWVGEDGVARTVRSCVEGPVLRGDRVRWDAR